MFTLLSDVLVLFTVTILRDISVGSCWVRFTAKRGNHERTYTESLQHVAPAT